MAPGTDHTREGRRHPMRVLSVNVGLPREVSWRGKRVTTGIYKEPVAGRVAIRVLNLDGDGQADLRVHGGRDKAVYAYPSESYALWSRERPELALAPGAFGENLTTEGVLEENVSVGDRFRVGTAELGDLGDRSHAYEGTVALSAVDGSEATAGLGVAAVRVGRAVALYSYFVDDPEVAQLLPVVVDTSMARLDAALA